MTDFGAEIIRLRLTKGDDIATNIVRSANIASPLVGSDTMINLGLGLLSSTVLYGRGGFSPVDLFANGEQGAWYDPSDFSTMFQDFSGLTPVTAVEQPVAVLLDKSKGLALGPELVTNGDFSSGTTGWTSASGGVLSNNADRLQIVSSGAAQGATQVVTLVVGTRYKVTVTVVSATANYYIGCGSGFGQGQSLVSAELSGPKTFTAYFVATASTPTFWLYCNGAGTFIFDNVSIKLISGNHASQSTEASRPVLSARVNQLTYTEQFDNAAWTKNQLLAFGSGSTANATTAPDGTTTADLITENTSNDGHGVSQSPSAASLVAYTSTAYFKRANGTRNAYIQINNNVAGTGGAVFASYDLTGAGAASAVSVLVAGFTSTSAAITPLSDGWYRCTLSLTTVATTTSLGVYCSIFNAARVYTGDGTSGIYIWGADLRVTNVGVGLPAYQRVAAATDYDTSGFPLYLKFDGTDDSLATGTIDPGSVNKAQVFAGVRKLSDATQLIAETSADSFSNNGTIGVYNFTDKKVYVSSRGTTYAETSTAALTAPITRVLTLQGDISAPSVKLNDNAVAGTTVSTSQGTGNYASNALYIGRRNNATLPFNGNLYSLILRFGANLSDAQIASTETYVNNLTKAY